MPRHDPSASQWTGRVRVGDGLRLVAAWTVSSLTLILADALQPNLSAESSWAFVAVAAVSGLAGLVVRPVFVELGARLGWVAVLPLAVAGQAVGIYVAMLIVPGITATFFSAVVASWLSAVVATAVAYLTSAGTDEALTTALLRRGRARTPPPDLDVDGVVFVQIDGLPFPVMRWALQAGGVPTMRRWITAGDYALTEWTAQLPCTTPASQLGILHGTVRGVPAFRWYDRELGRVIVANRPADARIIEERASDGHGLLCEDGASISNLFSGDAKRAMLTMSRARPERGVTQTRRAVAWFLVTPAGFSRSITRTVAEVVKERWQARRQERRGLQPRVHRGWTFALLRAVTNALLRDLNTALVAEEMLRGTRVVFVDYVDYDEVAHHAGMFRPESLASLDGLDRVLAQLERLSQNAARRYRFVVLSDHGQSQGEPFRDRYGEDLGALCAGLMAEAVGTFEQPVEGWGRAGSLIQDLGHEGVSGHLVAPADRRVHRRLGEERRTPDDVIVLGSGNLGLLYIRSPKRLALDDVAARWPRLLPGLRAHPGVGFVAGLDQHGVPWALGPAGRRNLATGAVEGVDPLAGLGPHSSGALLRAVSMPEAPELYVNSRIDPGTLDVAAFESLVGAHGGLGGWQDRAVLLAPRQLLPARLDRINGADELHRVLLSVLERAGQRRGSSSSTVQLG